MKDHKSNYQSDLRKKAEERLKQLSIDPHYLNEADVRQLAQDLQIYKVELEIQNEELRNTQSELQRSFSQFYELFNSAPVGYIVLDDVGIILKANQTFSTLTGLDTAKLLHKPFTSLLNEEDADIFFSRYKAIHKKPEGKVLELKIIGNDNHFFYARLEGSIINLDIDKRTDDSNPYFLFAVSDITSEKITQSELTKSESKFRQLFNFITDAIMLIKPVSESEGYGKILEVNDIACERYGYTRDEFLTLTLEDIDAPEVLGGVSQKIRTILESGTELWEGSHVKKDGVKIPVEIHVRTFNYNNETVILSSVRDISERKKAEAALKESENRFKNLVNSTDEIIFTLDTEMRHTGVYGPWVKNSGFTEELFIGKTFRDILGEHASVHENAFKRAIKGEYVIYDWTVPTDEGVKYYQTSFNPIRNDSSKITGLVGIGRNITDLIRFKSNFEKFFEQPQSLNLIADLKGRIIHVNNGWEIHLGYSNDELIGKKFFEFIHPDDIVATEQVMDEIKSGATIFKFENRYLSKDGNYKTLFWSANVDVNNNLVYGAAHDITEKKMAEQTLKQYAEELEVAYKSKEQFFSIISHDLRSPFNGLLGLSKILAEEIETLARDEISLYAKTLNNSLKTQYQLLNDLLEWAKVQSRSAKLNFTNININELAKYEAHSISLLLHQKGILFESLIDDELCINADENMLKLVIRNLISNSIKFTERGGRITLSAMKQDGLVNFSVKDTGIGISPENLNVILNQNQRFTTEGTESEQGSGLGLMLCKEIITKHGGELVIESKLGVGTKISFSLPT